MDREALDVLREEALALLRKDNRSLIFRSCWNCNSAHERLKTVDNCVINCFECGHYYYKGVDITKEEG